MPVTGKSNKYSNNSNNYITNMKITSNRNDNNTKKDKIK